MGRYDELVAHLKAIATEEATLSFADVAELLGARLPMTAASEDWWANKPTSPQARDGWLRAGWRVSVVDAKAKTVTFRRVSRKANVRL